ncbi:hypothetical protein Cme02nite_25620 [Catellatospora methionotrophica]|uniref:Uncharacterized protein n=1 Tax=Catellatospora methionotrophica TaxID=121620 RepID=A0A8J3LGU5_9ACTN|nr:hypothetical protein [Catellatospora methionotrophica]GIG14230.1 hypothetical protein Cme02nite_25620 [Catellatospora methionotrophica]
MSAIASFHVLDRSDIARLVAAAQLAAARDARSDRTYEDVAGGGHELPGDTLRLVGRRVADDYGWSGYCMVHLLTYLKERGADLFASEHRAEFDIINSSFSLTLPITPAHRVLLPRLDPAVHGDDELLRHFASMDYGFEEAATAARDGLRILRDQLTALADHEILVLHVG